MKKNKANSTPKTSNSRLLESLLQNISNEELEKTENKRRLSIKILKGIEATGLKRYEFAKKIKKNNVEVNKWLSGTHNFTVDTLFFLENELGIKLLDLELHLEE